MQGHARAHQKRKEPAMKACRIAAGIACCLILATGCCMCQHPSYDCGPVWSQGACRNCNPDYRAGSILNRHDPDVVAAGDAPRATEPARRIARTAGAGTLGSNGSDSQIRATPVAQQRRTPRPAAASQSAQSPPKTTVLSETPSPNDLPATIRRTAPAVAAPPGTKEGDTRILSVTDRRLDKLQEGPMPIAAQPKSPQPTVEKPSEDLGGWRPVTPRQEPLEAATLVAQHRPLRGHRTHHADL